MTDDREPFREARAAGKAASQAKRLENATYTAAEVKVLTEAALRLGRKEALEEVAVAVAKVRERQAEVGIFRLDEVQALLDAQDATTARTDPSGYSDLPQDSKAVRSPQEES